ncbi:ABC transporter permease [Salinarimonas sp.]|uniref:ABC transporter permease n=1 Tax=Salinarimonas sp. TaxID=2766526 RepID=UPI0032D92891
MSALFLATAYLRFHWGRSLVVIVSAALILLVPAATHLLLGSAERALTARAEATPLLLASRGSALDATMAALYFTADRPEPLPMREVDAIRDGGLAVPIPLHTAFEARGRRIVGTTLDYFELRGLDIAEGRGLALLGEAVVGADAAAALALGPGDTLVSTPNTLFDLDGAYPLEMPIVGVLARRGTPDDEAVFVDLKTAWVIAGLGHGHADPRTGEDAGAPPATAYRRITPETIESFHFHGDRGAYPVTAAIVAPRDARAATILQGRYLDPDGGAQLIRPDRVAQSLVERVLRIRPVLDAVTAIVAAAATAAIALALHLSYRLRAPEVATAVRLGASRGSVLRLLAVETALLLGCAAILAGAATLALGRHAEAATAWLLALGPSSTI